MHMQESEGHRVRRPSVQSAGGVTSATTMPAGGQAVAMSAKRRRGHPGDPDAAEERVTSGHPRGPHLPHPIVGDRGNRGKGHVTAATPDLG